MYNTYFCLRVNVPAQFWIFVAKTRHRPLSMTKTTIFGHPVGTGQVWVTFPKSREQAGAELCQAQVKQGLAKLDFLSKKLSLSSLC